MSIESTFVLYLILFRLAIITAGVISIVLGYRLFCRGVWPDAGPGKGTSVDAKIAGSRFTLKNAAPGTCFAMFGVLIISIMFASGGPELTLNMLKGIAQTGTSMEDSTRTEKFSLKLKSKEKDALHTLTQKALHFEEQEDTANAIAAYEDAISIMAEPINNLAWLYQGQGNMKEALALSRMAVQLLPNNANYLDTLAEILFKTGNYDEALSLMEKAANLDPRYQHKLPKFRQAKNK